MDRCYRHHTWMASCPDCCAAHRPTRPELEEALASARRFREQLGQQKQARDNGSITGTEAVAMRPPAKILDHAKAADIEHLRDQITGCLSALRAARDVYESRPCIENESQVVRLTDRLDYLLNKHPRQ
jgi:hypothetical protein